MSIARLATVVCTAAVITSACGSSVTDSEPIATDSSASASASIVIDNEGGALEGHTPRGFEGSGTGLFAGDELNSNFPTDDGVQIWLSFQLPGDVAAVSEARLQSSFLTVRGNPFEALGSLQAAPVRYDEFGPSVVGLDPVGSEVTCPTPVDDTFTCDVTDAVNNEIDAGRDRVQIRLRFEIASDPDGDQDMALFFKTDSNTNEPGTFELVLR